MIRSILIVSGEKPLSNRAKDQLLQIVGVIQQSGKEIHIFKEDVSLWDVLRNEANVKYINGLNSSADLLLFNKEHEGVYLPTDSVMAAQSDHSTIYKRAISRHVATERSKSFDELEYRSMRNSIVNRRLKFAIAQIAEIYQFVINFKDSKEFNLLNSLKPGYGDGKFLYTYDGLKDRVEFAVGGCELPSDNFELCIKGV